MEEPLDGDGMTGWIVRFTEPPVARYRGARVDLEATSPRATGRKRLDTDSRAFRAYRRWLRDRQDQHLQDIGDLLQRSVPVSARLSVTLNAAIMRLTPAEAREVESLPQVAYVERNYFVRQQTDFGPAWIQAPLVWDGTAPPDSVGTHGEGTIVAILDSGIDPAHPSFAATDMHGFTHENPLGEGEFVGLCDPQDPDYDPDIACNAKMIGFRDYVGEGLHHEDFHGVHVGSTAAGNFVEAQWDGFDFDYEAVISGVAPRANVISYVVCLSGSCSNQDRVQAIEDAVIDGVDVINESLAIGGSSPYQSAVQQAFLGALEAGVIGVRSIGNAGPELGTALQLEPVWTLSVGATTHDREFVDGEAVSNPEIADHVGNFSSRGPADVRAVKPDVAAPGSFILAADIPDPDAGDFEVYRTAGGTSMATPHAAGAAALVRALNPEWTVAEVMSALTATAVHEGVVTEEDRPAHAFDIGGGRIDLDRAIRTGLVLDISPSEFEAADPELDGDARELNLVGLFDHACFGQCQWERTVRNPTSQTVTWEAEYHGPGRASINPESFTLAPDDKQTLEISLDLRMLDADSEWRWGRVILDSGHPDVPDFGLPVAAKLIPTTSPKRPAEVLIESAETAVASGNSVRFDIGIVGYGEGEYDIHNPLPAQLEFKSGSAEGGLEYEVGGHFLHWGGELEAPVAKLPNAEDNPPVYEPVEGDNIMEMPVFETNPNWTRGFGVDFEFAGLSYDLAMFSAHGWLKFGREFWNGTDNFTTLPDSSIEVPLVAPYWSNFDPEAGGRWFWAFNVMHNGKPHYVYEWRNVAHADDPDVRVSFQVWIERETSNIWFVYGPGDWDSIPEGIVGFQTDGALAGFTRLAPGSGISPSAGDQYRIQFEPTKRSFSYEAFLNADSGQIVKNIADLYSPDSVESAWTAVYSPIGTTLAFEQQPTDLLVDQKIDPPIDVRIEDEFGMLATGDDETAITLDLYTDPSGGEAELAGTLTRTASSGVASFDDLVLDVAAEGYSLKATATGLDEATSKPFSALNFWNCEEVTDVPAADCKALVALALSTNIEQWSDNQGWMLAESAEVCPATGVFCEGGRITQLFLQDNNLQGMLPEELTNLEMLEVIEMSRNSISGDLPEFLGELDNLRSVRLGRNQLTGTIPSEWASLDGLEALFIDSNEIEGEIPDWLYGMDTLERLGLSSNELKGALSPDLGNLYRLQWLSLSGNSFSGELPPSIVQLEELEFLLININEFSGALPDELGNLDSLVQMRANGNNFSGSIPESVSQLESVEFLDLRSNQLTGRIPEQIGQLSNLQFLRLNNNEFFGEVPPEIKDLESLQQEYQATALGLAENCLTAEGSTLDFIKQFDDEFPDNQECSLMVAWVDPSHGPVAGGLEATLHGTEFQPGIQVDFDGQSCTDVTVIDTFSLTCMVPPGDVGPVTVKAENPDGELTQASDAFFYGAMIFQDAFVNDGEEGE